MSGESPREEKITGLAASNGVRSKPSVSHLHHSSANSREAKIEAATHGALTFGATRILRCIRVDRSRGLQSVGIKGEVDANAADRSLNADGQHQDQSDELALHGPRAYLAAGTDATRCPQEEIFRPELRSA